MGQNFNTNEFFAAGRMDYQGFVTPHLNLSQFFYQRVSFDHVHLYLYADYPGHYDILYPKNKRRQPGRNFRGIAQPGVVELWLSLRVRVSGTESIV